MASAKKEAAPDEGAVAKNDESGKPEKVRVVCAGHVIEADPTPPTPAPLTRDSVTGQIVDPDAVADTSGGWAVGED